MNLFKSGNPILTEKAFKTSKGFDYANAMTVRGTLSKFGFMFLMLLGTAYYSWKEFAIQGNVTSLALMGVLGGTIVAFIIIFKKEWSPYLSPLFALLEGLAIGAISAMYNKKFEFKAPGIIMTSVGLTFGIVIAMYLLYSFRIIKVTEKFKSVVLVSIIGIVIFYFIAIVLRMFGIDMDFIHEGSIFGIIFSLVVVGVASLTLTLNFDMIEKNVEAGAPKYMEWYAAFGLMITIVWLYLEILSLVSKLNSRR